MKKEVRYPTRDLFTNELRPLVLKAGNGRHIPLKREPGEPTARAGMAHFAGTGPAGTYCRTCAECQDIPVFADGTNRPPVAAPNRPPKTVMRDACAKAMRLYGKVQPGGLRARASCKYYEPAP